MCIWWGEKKSHVSFLFPTCFVCVFVGVVGWKERLRTRERKLISQTTFLKTLSASKVLQNEIVENENLRGWYYSLRNESVFGGDNFFSFFLFPFFFLSIDYIEKYV